MDAVPSITTVVARALHTAAEVLRDEAPQDGLVYGDLWERVLAREPRLEAEWRQAVQESSQSSGTPFKSYVNRAATNLVQAGWLHRGLRVWQLTGIGLDALDRWPDAVDFFGEASRRYRQWERQKQGHLAAVTALEQLPDSGYWVALDELAEEFGVDSDVLGPFLLSSRRRGWYLALDEDGVAGGALPLWPHERDLWRTSLDAEGLLDTGRSSLDTVRALPDRRMPVWDAVTAAKQPTEGGDAEPEQARQLWILRGKDATTGVSLIRGPWREQSVITHEAGFLPLGVGGHDVTGVRRLVEAALPAAGPTRREAVTRELDAFLNRMRPGDIVLSTDGFDTYVGVVTGPATRTGDQLARPVEWRNLDKPLDFFKDLPSGLSGVVQDADSQVLEATEYAETVLALTDGMRRAAPEPKGPAILPDATAELAARLNMPDEVWLQDCVELLRSTPQLIFHGPPGTGKTYIALALARHLAGASGATNVRLVQFHPAYAYEDFFEGIRPRLSGGKDANEDGGGGGLGYDLVRGPLRKLADEAERRPAEVFVLVIDEINRGHLAKIFGELYFLLEYRNERVHLLYGSDDGRGFLLPPNLYILGTMNTVDRSVAYMDAAMRRRFSFIELHPDLPPVSGVLGRWLRNGAEERGEAPAAVDDSYVRLLDEINRMLAEDRPGDRSFRVGPSYFMQDLAHNGDGALERLWRTQIIPLLTEHHWGDGQDVETVYALDTLRDRLGIRPPIAADDAADS
ncbi:MAG: AAA domain-containing protein [Streptomyces sp.]|nr:AAA domain-containing protein [Streptomyces sp.]NUS29937.1 AAA domain-containing protein [Streptomyces sp.]NUS87015.1 AAA domain-containing protein [Streptomyces sp.]